MDTVDGKDVSPLLKGEVSSIKDIAVTEWPWSKTLRWKNWRFVHYHRKMYDGEDIGELYNIEEDPFEMRNLYYEQDYKDIVNECRRLLLEWLTETTRITTVWPYLEEDKSAFQNKERYKLAADGREPNTKGPFARLKLRRTGSFNVCDYL